MLGQSKSLSAKLRTAGIPREWRHSLLIWLPILCIVLYFLNDLQKSHDRALTQTY